MTADPGPSGADRHPVRVAHRAAVGVPAAGDGLRARAGRAAGAKAVSVANRSRLLAAATATATRAAVGHGPLWQTCVAASR